MGVIMSGEVEIIIKVVSTTTTITSSSYSSSSTPSTVEDIPDELLQACFARLPLKCLFRVKAVCKRWFRLSDPRYLYQLRKTHGFTEPWAYILNSKYEQGCYTGLQISGGQMIKNDNINHNYLSFGSPLAVLKGPPRLQFAATAGADGLLLYVLGGRSPFISKRPDTWVVFHRVDVYDPVSNSCYQAKPMNAARYAFAVGSFIHNNEPRLIVAGGYDVDGLALHSAEIYDARLDQWEIIPCMQTVSGACKGEFTRGKFYVKMANNGPYAIEVYDPSLRCWSSVSSPHETAPLSIHTSEMLAFTSPGAIIFYL